MMTKMNKYNIGYFIIYCLFSVVFILLFILMAVVLSDYVYKPYVVIPVTYIFSAVLFWLVSLYMDD